MPDPVNPEPKDGYWQRVEEIFQEALDVPGEARSAFIRARSAGDASLEREVSEILAGYDAQDRISAQNANGSPEALRFGAFEIVRKIGEGGMGAVYLARRSEDFEQRAAIKLINGTPAGAALMADRFLEERRILAALEHPNIARLLDGGITRDRQPYLVMEYVEGVRLDQYCESKGLSIPQRLELFRKICAAVHFAHQHLVIHRDLKHGNILVNQQGEPKLLDFGIAKVLSPPGASPEETATMTAGLLLTPQYASPEQIQGLPCTIATDIYSLGVILYELLTGKAPHAEAAATPAEMISAVVFREAERPSVAAPAPLKAQLRGDLDGIVMKSLAKQPDQRYGSVEQFSEDVRRHLEGLPVTAVEGSRVYLARKFVRRHRLAVAAAALILVSLVAGLAGTLWQARAARRQRDLAEQRFSDARKLADYLLFSLYDSVQALPGSLPVRADMATQSLLYLDRLAAARSEDPALRRELAEGYLRLGLILEAPVGYGDSLGNAGKALESDQKALALLEPLARANRNDTRIQQDLAHAYLQLGPVLNYSGKPDQGIGKLNQANAIFETLVASNPRDVAGRVDAGRAYVALMDVISGRGGGVVEPASKDQVMAASDKAIAHFDAALAVSPVEPRALLGLATAYNTRGTLFAASGDLQTAIGNFTRGLDTLQRLPSTEKNADTEGTAARMETMIGYCQGELGQIAAALATLKQAQDVLDRLGASDPKNATIAFRRVNLFRTRAAIHQYAGHLKDAISDHKMTIQILDGMVATDPSKMSNRLIRAEEQGKLAALLVKDGQLSEATGIAKAGIQYLDEIADRPDASPQILNEASIAHMDSAVAALVDNARALRYAQRADQLAEGKDPIAIFYLTQAYENLRDGPHAMEAVERGLALVPAPAPGQQPSRKRMLMEKHLHRIETFLKTGRFPDDK